jgi:microcystin-dependent protein
MSEPFLSELKCVSFNFAPKGWSMCNGQLMQINQNQALFSLLGTTYGGDGRVTFGLPDMRGNAAIHVGQGFTLGERGGEYNHTLSISEIPTHVHFLQADNEGQNSITPQNNLLANTTSNLGVYGPPNSLVPMFAPDISNVGGSQPHPNQSPYLVMTWIIALTGIFPSQN